MFKYNNINLTLILSPPVYIRKICSFYCFRSIQVENSTVISEHEKPKMGFYQLGYKGSSVPDNTVVHIDNGNINLTHRQMDKSTNKWEIWYKYKLGRVSEEVEQENTFKISYSSVSQSSKRCCC